MHRNDAPAYSLLPTSAGSSSLAVDNDSENGTHATASPYSEPQRRSFSLSRFLADFTLGFADGLTVPFALTAGLSSLGQANTVILAGMAEICAGSISMGIGGYLAARGEAPSCDSAPPQQGEEDPEKSGPPPPPQIPVHEYLAPLRLPPDLLRQVTAHVGAAATTTTTTTPAWRPRADANYNEATAAAAAAPPAPWFVGLSVALGYLVGGLLPLSPYFFFRGDEVARGLRWSFGICLCALFVFGFGKDYLLHAHRHQQTRSWRLRRSAAEGMRMVVLGGLAAVAAVLCVKAFEGMRGEE
ncbi:VIT family-domain-containing protein [Xylariomycetidae sp. FL0641]|nr:VIT family-domain-containing protein [Xylariomycetidae sp. FL0641]